MLNISATVSMWGCIVLAVASLGGAYFAFSSLETLADAAEREAMWSYVWFAVFVFAVAAALGALCWLIKEGKLGDPDRM
jgi:hypothetical protein